MGIEKDRTSTDVLVLSGMEIRRALTLPASSGVLLAVCVLTLLLFPFSQCCIAAGTPTAIPLSGKTTLPAFYFMPEGRTGAPLPGIVVAAPAVAAQYVQYHNYCEKLACLGYAVLLFDAANCSKRLPSCPECWRQTPHNIWSWEMNVLVALRLALGYEWYVSNIGAAMDYWAHFPGVDSDRILLSGFSQSANAALSYAGSDPRVKGVVWNCGGWPWIMPYDPERLPPVLIFHGKRDGVYSVRNAIRLARELRNAGRDCECHLYDGGRHLFNIYYDLNAPDDHLKPAILSSFACLIKFCARVLGSKTSTFALLPQRMGSNNRAGKIRARRVPERKAILRSHTSAYPGDLNTGAPWRTTSSGPANRFLP